MRPLDVITIGETMMAFEATEYGPLRDITLFKKWIGGSEMNLAIGLARLGFRCGWVSRVGNDEFGMQIIRQARGEGVDVSQVTVDQDHPTGIFIVERHAQQEFRCTYYRKSSAASYLSPQDLDPDYVQQAKIVCLTGITPAISDSARECTIQLAETASQNGQTLVFDPNLRLTMWTAEQARQVLIPLMQMSDHVLAGDQELMLLMNADSVDDAIRATHDLGVKNLIVKQGSEGSLITAPSSPPVLVPPFKVNNPMSSMGAGDTFMAGFVAGLLQNFSLHESVRSGNAMGAFCVMTREPYYGLPSMDELTAFLANQEMITR